MRVWRLVTPQYAATALSGEGAARYGGRWNTVGTRTVYTADSLALATLELVVHLTGARVTYVAIELELPARATTHLSLDRLPDRWHHDDAATRPVGDEWLGSARSLALTVPSALVAPRSGERNVLINPTHPRCAQITEIQRFEVVLDERL